MESLKDKTARGLFWGGMNNGVQQLLGLAFGIILGRLLDPSDYGMTAMLAVFSVIANELQSSGFKTGLINLREPRHEDYNAVFWFNIAAGALIYAVLFLAAPLIARFYGNPALIPLSRYVFLGFVFSSFGMAQSAYLTKQMQIKQIAKCGMTATLTSSLVSVAMAAMGFGYWALATQYLMYIAVNTLLLWRFSAWRPTLSPLTSQKIIPFQFQDYAVGDIHATECQHHEPAAGTFLWRGEHGPLQPGLSVEFEMLPAGGEHAEAGRPDGAGGAARGA